MPINLGIVMDPIENILISKDSSFAMMLAAAKKGWNIHYLQQHDLYYSEQDVRASTRLITPADNPEKWFTVQSEQEISLFDLDVLLMRKDPPFDIEYITTTYLLEIVENNGTLVINSPSSLRDINEKMSITCFPQCCAPMLISRNQQRIKQFIHAHKDTILKPLDGMGGQSIFRVRDKDPNFNVILETITNNGNKTIMAQKYIQEIAEGDKRILLIDGEPVPFALARIPAEGESRGNLATGGKGIGIPLSDRDYWICEQVGPTLKNKGILFAGIDVIGKYLTEINITSPTCIRELDHLYDLDIAGQLMTCIGHKLDATDLSNK